VDGTYYNTNIDVKKGELQTSLSMGYYDVTNGIPIDMNFEGTKNKNNEVNCLYDYIEKHDEKKNFIFVADRGYFKYSLFKKITDCGFNYVIRLRNNSLINENVKKTNPNYEIIQSLKETSRVVTYSGTHDKTMTDRKGEASVVKTKSSIHY